MVTHTFKSKEAKAKMGEVVASMKMEDIVKSMTGETAKCQMTWNTPGETLTMFCWWKGTDPDAINKQLESMNDFFEPHQFYLRAKEPHPGEQKFRDLFLFHKPFLENRGQHRYCPIYIVPNPYCP